MSDMRQVHEWFLHRGLPLVLTRRVRSRALIERSAPMVSGVGAVISLTMLLAELTDGDPDFGYVTRLGVLTVLLVAAPFALYLLHQTGTTLGEAGRRSAALLVMALFVFGLPFAASGFSGFAAAEAVGFAVVPILAIWLTYIGFGSIALWAFRFAWVQFGALEVRALREDRAEQTDPAKLLAGTPLESQAGHPPVRTPLSVAEQVNVVAVMVVSQAIQVVSFTTGLFAFFLALGIVAVPDDVAVLWSAEQTCAVGQPPCPGTWFGIHVPVPQTIVQVSLFVAVLSGLYFTVSTSVDPLYRERFFNPLIDDVAVSLAGRDAYLELETTGS